MDEIRIEYDDDALAIIDKINDALDSRGLILVPDEQEHDGFEIYNLEEIDEDNENDEEE